MIHAFSRTITKKNVLAIFFCFYTITASFVLQATSIVYSLRIRRIFLPQAPIPEHLRMRHWLLTAVPIVGNRIDNHLLSNDYESILFGGSVFNARYRFNANWGIEGTTATLKERIKFRHQKVNGYASASGFDDVVVNIFCNLFPRQDTQCIVHILAGAPTNKSLSTFERYNRLVGTKFFSLGGGIEASTMFFKREKSCFFAILQARLIHFFERELSPILPRYDTLHPGNVTDFFGAIHYRCRNNHVECGYDSTLYTNGRLALARSINKIPYFFRNSFYGSYVYIVRNQGAVGFGGSVQFVRAPFISHGFNLWVNGSLWF